MTPEPIDPQPIIYALSALGVAFAIAVSVWQWLRKRKAPEKPAEVQAAPEDPRCPCGAVATHPLPRHKVVELPIVGRIVLRQRDPFGAPVVCDAHADVAATVVDERIAEAKLADARAERDRITALANGTDALSAVVGTLPEEKQKAYARSLRPAPVVRQLKAANGEEGNAG